VRGDANPRRPDAERKAPIASGRDRFATPSDDRDTFGSARSPPARLAVAVKNQRDIKTATDEFRRFLASGFSFKESFA
jgi:hypothetical protein